MENGVCWVFVDRIGIIEALDGEIAVITHPAKSHPDTVTNALDESGILFTVFNDVVTRRCRFEWSVHVKSLMRLLIRWKVGRNSGVLNGHQLQVLNLERQFNSFLLPVCKKKIVRFSKCLFPCRQTFCIS